MKLEVVPEYVSVACNRIPEIADWSENGLICFGATNAVVLYDTKQVGGNPLTVLSHHKSIVNSVKWLRRSNGLSTEFVSCSADKTAAIWSLKDGLYTPTSVLKGHTEGITCIGGIYLNDNDVVLFTASIDSTIRIWERKNGEVSQIQTINLNSGLCLTAHAHLLPTIKKPVIFFALDDHKIHIYSAATQGESGDSDVYHRLHVLTGHDDWVRGMDVLDIDADTILLASSSQDTHIRLWKIQRHMLDDEPTKGIKVEQKLFRAYDVDWSVKLDAVLSGHEGWVYGVQWAPYELDKETKARKPVYRLLSSSLDKTLIIWEPQNNPETKEGEGIWVERVRVGEVGGNGLGFYGSRFGPSGKSFMGHGYNGSFHIWKYCQETNKWDPSVVCGGHFGVVEDVRWEPHHGRYVTSVSADQTTRVHAPWCRDNGSKIEWHEIARPQVHGYDMAAIALVSSTTFASAAEEKVIRVFRAPHNFSQNFHNITGWKLVDGVENGGEPEGASVPSLGLSNKAVFSAEENSTNVDDDNDGYFVPMNLTEPPTEETLLQNTLWPEVKKLYGHGYEVFALDASPDGTCVASACKATNAEHAAVLIWETTNWTQVQKLVSHQLTVTQLAFSPDSRRLLSVSRDRRWTLYQRSGGSNSFEIAATTDKKNGVHSRIIWCCAWSHDGDVFGTGSRDGKVCLWSKAQTPTDSSLKDYGLLGTALELANTSVTALAFAPFELNSRILAIGCETGEIRIYAFEKEWSPLVVLNNSEAHHLTVKRATFKPKREENDEVMLASCGNDHLVRLYRVTVKS